MAEKKSILEEALLDVKNIQSALNANTKEILRSVAKEEIDGVVKESLMKNEAAYEEEEANDEPVELGGDANAATADVEGGAEGEETSTGGLDDIEGSEEVVPPMDPELGTDSVELGAEPMDMTQSTDDDVIAIYKKLSGEDEIEIVGDEIHLNISEPGEYVVKAGDAMPTGDESGEAAAESPLGDESGVDYEIEMGGDEEGGAEEAPADLEPVDDEEGEEETEEGGSEEGEEKEELEEAIPVGSAQAHRLPGKANIGQPKGAGADNLKESTKLSNQLVLEQKKYNALLTETNKLKAENEDFRKALKVFRGQLVETVVFNSNLTYTTRLFMEHSTTKAEKEAIIKRFDNEVTNLIESKKLYKTIASELSNRKPINESIESKIIKEVTTGASKQLNESTAFVDPSTQRIIDLMNRVDKR